jgi:HAD superfamily hydrolase (TIGR01509 family)
MLKGIIFDLDGVIVDSHSAHKKAWRALLESLGSTVDQAALDFVVEGNRREEILRHFLGELNEEEIRRLGALKRELFAEVAHEVKTVPGAVEFVRAATDAGFALAVGTSAGRKRAEETLESFGLKSHFRTVITGDDVSAGKPDPAVFIRAAEGLGVPAEHVLVCEDAVLGVQAAKRAGMKCLAIAANGRRALLKSAGANWVTEDFRYVSLDELQALFSYQTGTGKSACATRF